ncbi:PREDICTED: uncharacterized protein LOC108577467 [Habropoda laboriosa]|uniref:uncharacterized protein LOC108577467 n=1 Tax=Habropoda laboriosa TaxID=597456 RepID=UPI00083DE28D|nr:PREDICTED: uncharacterized protein LOC108577467 [Habropoda laboriosa]
MNDSQNQNSFDFVPKSDYKEKWHLENKCLFHNQQFVEGEKRKTERKCTISEIVNGSCPHFDEKFISNTDGNTLNKKSGDWKCNEGNIVQEPTIAEWRWKNPYSISDFDRSKHWYRKNFTSGDNISTNLLHTIDGRYKNPTRDDPKRNFLYNFREYLVNYQESCGVPRSEYSFLALIRTMGRATGRSLLALLYVMLNIIPVVEVFLYLLRFILDKVISIRNSKDFRQTMVRCFIFTAELFSVYVCLIFIFGFIVLPVVHMVIDIVAKIMPCN